MSSKTEPYLFARTEHEHEEADFVARVSHIGRVLQTDDADVAPGQRRQIASVRWKWKAGTTRNKTLFSLIELKGAPSPTYRAQIHDWS